MAATRIEWAGRVWNPVTGCTPISEGCANCYAARMAKRLVGRYGYPPADPFTVTVHKDRLRDLVRAGALIAAEIDRLQREKV